MHAKSIASAAAAAALLAALIFLSDAPAGGRLIVDVIRPGGTCASPNADNGAYALHGWKLPGAFTYKINSGSIPKGLDKTQVIAAIDAAAAAWDGSSSASLLANGGATTLKAGKRDGVNTVSFGGAPYGAIAVAYIWASDGTVLEADMSFSNGFKWATNSAITEDPADASDDCSGQAGRMDVGDVATHEFGHWLGVAHTPDDPANNAQSMYPFAAYRELFKRSLASGDVAGLVALYGP